MVPATDPHDVWKLMLDVSHFGDFKSNEIGVRLLEHEVEIIGKQNWRPHPGGSVRKEFAQRHKIPNDINKDGLKAYMTKEGMLIIKAPRITVASIKGHQEVMKCLQQLQLHALNKVKERSPNPVAQVFGIRRDIDDGPYIKQEPIVPLPPKPRSVHKDLLFQDVTRVYPAN